MMPTKYPSSVGIPTNLLHNFVIDTEGISDYAATDLLFCPHSSDREFDFERDTPPRASTSLVGNRGSFRWGALYLPSVAKLVEIGSGNFPAYSTEVACFMPREEMHSRPVGKSISMNHGDYICIQISIKVTLVSQAHPFVEVFIQPRTIIENKLPVSILVRTPMPFTFSPPDEKGLCTHSPFDLHDHVNHRLEPQQAIEIFSPGSSIAIRSMCAVSETIHCF